MGGVSSPGAEPTEFSERLRGAHVADGIEYGYAVSGGGGGGDEDAAGGDLAARTRMNGVR